MRLTRVAASGATSGWTTNPRGLALALGGLKRTTGSTHEMRAAHAFAKRVHGHISSRRGANTALHSTRRCTLLASLLYYEYLYTDQAVAPTRSSEDERALSLEASAATSERCQGPAPLAQSSSTSQVARDPTTVTPK